MGQLNHRAPELPAIDQFKRKSQCRLKQKRKMLYMSDGIFMITSCYADQAGG